MDHALAPEGPTLSLHWQDDAGFIFNVEERVRNTSAMPMKCFSILQSDVVPNISVAHDCRSWCRESLGLGSAFAYAFSPYHYMIMSYYYTSEFHILKTCWKVETASWALEWMPHVWLIYFYSLAYGSISAFTLLYLLYVNHSPNELSYSKFFECDSPASSGESSGESSGIGEANWSLHFGVLGTLVEPSLDLLSVLTFLHNGQPHFAFYVILGLLLSFRHSCDPFQLKGARAAAESFKQGFESKEFLQHKKIERIETLISTAVQVYAVLILDIRAVQFFAALNLMGGAAFSVLVSLPSQQEARWIMDAPPVPINLENAEEIQRIKALQPWQSRASMSLMPLALAFCVHVVLGQETKPRPLEAVLDGLVWGEWQISVLSVGVWFFRLMALVSGPCYVALFCSAWLARDRLQEQGLIQRNLMPGPV
eukprot:Skav209886  [mRNA]  locus=scaffold2642:232902:234173:- [translate_table: standard]